MLSALATSLRDGRKVAEAITEIMMVQLLMLAIILVCILGRWSGSFEADETSLPLFLSCTTCLFLLGLAIAIKGTGIVLDPKRPSTTMDAVATGLGVGLLVSGVTAVVASSGAIMLTILLVVKEAIG